MQRSIFLQHLSAKISEGSVKGRRNVGEVAELELFSLNMIQYYKFLNMKCFAIPFISLSTMLLKFPPFSGTLLKGLCSPLRADVPAVPRLSLLPGQLLLQHRAGHGSTAEIRHKSWAFN